MNNLTNEEILRYHRQISVYGFDFEKQEKLKHAKAIIVGMGGLGCAAATYLTLAGFGELLLIDADKISLSNLQRQLLYHEKDIGAYKVDIAAQTLSALNPFCLIKTAITYLPDPTFVSLLKDYSVVLDCTDNLATRNDLNQICYQYKIPLISGAAIRMEGLLTSFQYQDEQPCYQCLSHLFGNQPISCSESGVISPLVGIIGSMQAMEAIKIVAQFGQPLTGKLLLLDALTMQTKELLLTKNPQCQICRLK